MADQTGMQPAEPQAAPVVPVVKQVKQLLSQDKIKEKFGEVLGQKALSLWPRLQIRYQEVRS